MFQVPRKNRYKFATWMLVPFGLSASAFFFFNHQATPSLEHALPSDNHLESRKTIAKVISGNVTQSKFPTEISFNSENPKKVTK